MNLFDPNDIPGYTEAREREQANRDLAFLDLPIPLCGVVVRQFSLKHLILLTNCQNGFIAGAGTLPESHDIAQFLWIVSTGYSLDAKARNKFVKGLRALKYGGCVAEISAYLATAFQDAPMGGSSGKLYTASCAFLVDVLANEYHWRDEDIMEKPIARLFQYLRLIQKRHNPKALLFNQSDRIISNHLRQGMAPKDAN